VKRHGSEFGKPVYPELTLQTTLSTLISPDS